MFYTWPILAFGRSSWPAGTRRAEKHALAGNVSGPRLVPQSRSQSRPYGLSRVCRRVTSSRFPTCRRCQVNVGESFSRNALQLSSYWVGSFWFSTKHDFELVFRRPLCNRWFRSTLASIPLLKLFFLSPHHNSTFRSYVTFKPLSKASTTGGHEQKRRILANTKYVEAAEPAPPLGPDSDATAMKARTRIKGT